MDGKSATRERGGRHLMANVMKNFDTLFGTLSQIKLPTQPIQCRMARARGNKGVDRRHHQLLVVNLQSNKNSLLIIVINITTNCLEFACNQSIIVIINYHGEFIIDNYHNYHHQLQKGTFQKLLSGFCPLRG